MWGVWGSYNQCCSPWGKSLSSRILPRPVQVLVLKDPPLPVQVLVLKDPPRPVQVLVLKDPPWPVQVLGLKDPPRPVQVLVLIPQGSSITSTSPCTQGSITSTSPCPQGSSMTSTSPWPSLSSAFKFLSLIVKSLVTTLVLNTSGLCCVFRRSRRL